MLMDERIIMFLLCHRHVPIYMNTFISRYQMNAGGTILAIIFRFFFSLEFDWFYRYANTFGVILCWEVKELRTLNVYICIIVFKFSFYLSCMISSIPNDK